MKHNQLRSIGELNVSNDPRAAHADITNASHLVGDVFGDTDVFGDSDAFGDSDDDDDDFFSDEDGDVFGDIDVLSPYKLISGDVYGDAARAGRWKRRARRTAAVGGGVLAAGLVARAIKKRKMRKRALISRLSAIRSRQSSSVQTLAQRSMGKMPLNEKLQFFRVMGAKLNSSPIVPSSAFPAEMLKYNLDRQNSDTPFLQETVGGVWNGGTSSWDVTVPGVASNRYYPCIFLNIGTNVLNAAPGTIITITCTLPTIGATPLVITSTPFIMTYEKGFDVRVVIFPWQLVANKPLPIIGQYSNANNIIVNVSGIPQASAVSVVVPGSEHPWTIGMRNSLSRA